MKKKYFFTIVLSLSIYLMNWGQLSAEEQTMNSEMMQKMMKLTSASEAHQVFDLFVGNWNYIGKFKMSPDSPVQEMIGTSKMDLIYGGRFLQQTAQGPWMGMEFNGTGITGYDNVRKEYISIWFDNMSTGIMMMRGSYNDENKTINLAGEYSCPMKEKSDCKGRVEWTITSDDQHQYRSFNYDENGNEYLAMEITYSRAF